MFTFSSSRRWNRRTWIAWTIWKRDDKCHQKNWKNIFLNSFHIIRKSKQKHHNIYIFSLMTLIWVALSCFKYFILIEINNKIWNKFLCEHQTKKRNIFYTILFAFSVYKIGTSTLLPVFFRLHPNRSLRMFGKSEARNEINQFLRDPVYKLSKPRRRQIRGQRERTGLKLSFEKNSLRARENKVINSLYVSVCKLV